MHNSTVDKAAAPEEPRKKPKAPGPIRTGAVVPFVVISALTWGYFHFFFDGHLRRGIEYVGTNAVGAEVDVGQVETSFWDASLVVRDIQVTDSSMPSRNLIQIGTVSFQMLWDALLRGKVVIDHGDILDIQALSPRAKPGRVLPPEPKSQSYTDTLLASMKQQFDGNVLGDLAALAEGANASDQFSKLGDALKSSERVAALKEDLAKKEQEWQTRLASLPKSEELQALEKRLKAVKLDRFKDVQEMQASIKELESIRDAFNGHVNNVQGTGKALTADVTGYKGVWAELDKTVKQDVADLQAHFRVPSLDAKTLATVIFGPEMFNKVTDARGYMEKARAYMPPKRTVEEKKSLRLQPHERGTGRNYAFGRPNSYPLFWLKRVAISSKSGAGPYAGDLKGELLDVTTDAQAIGRPAILRVEGNFPAQSIYDTKFEVVIDHTTENPVERLTARVGRYGIAGRALVKSDAVQMGFAKASGSTTFTGELTGDKVDLRLVNDFTQIGYDVKAKSAITQEIISGALNSVAAVNVNARVFGTWSDLGWVLQSNMGEALEKGFRAQLQKKIDEARARIEAMVNERIAAERKKLQEQYAAAESRVKGQIAAKQAEVEKLRASYEQAKSKLEQQKNQAEQRLEQQKKAEEQRLKNEAGKYLQNMLKR